MDSSKTETNPAMSKVATFKGKIMAADGQHTADEPGVSGITDMSNDVEYSGLLRRLVPENLLNSLPAGERGWLKIPVPQWVTTGEDLQQFFLQYQQLWAGGRVVWAHLVQANTLLFEPGPLSAPGELVYDPTGRSGPLSLGTVARAVGALKGAQPQNLALRRIADHLTNEYTRAFAMAIPPSIAPGIVLLSTTYFHRPHLPGGMLRGPFFPILINDRLPGMVMVLPERWWPQRLRSEWLS